MKMRLKSIVPCLLFFYCAGCTLLINDPDEEDSDLYSCPYGSSLIFVTVDSTIVDSLSVAVPCIRKYVRIKNLSDDTILVKYIVTSVYSDATESQCISGWSDYPYVYLKSKAEYLFRIDWWTNQKYPHPHINHHYILYEHKFHSHWHSHSYQD